MCDRVSLLANEAYGYESQGVGSSGVGGVAGVGDRFVGFVGVEIVNRYA